MAELYVGAGGYATIKDAIKAAAAGDVIVISAGDYTAEGEIGLDKALTLQAAAGAEVKVDRISLGLEQHIPNKDNVAALMAVKGLTVCPSACMGADSVKYIGIMQNTEHVAKIVIENCTIDFSNTPVDKASVGIMMARSGIFDTDLVNVTIEGNTVIGNSKTDHGISVAMKGAMDKFTVTGNTFTGNYSKTAVSLDMPSFDVATDITITDNEIESNSNNPCIQLANLKNAGDKVTISGNTIVSECGRADRGAIFFYDTCTQVGSVTISGNDITSLGNGVNMTNIAGTTVAVTGNKITTAQSGIVGHTPAEGSNNTIKALESIGDLSNIYVNSKWSTLAAGTEVLAGAALYTIGINAFSTFDAAVAAASKDSVIKVMAGTTVNNNVTFMNADPTGGYYDMLTEKRNYGAYISGAVKMEQVIWNNSDLTIDSTGLVRTGEAFRVMGGSLTINGKRAANEDAPADLVPDHWGSRFEPHEKVSAQVGYLQVGLGAKAKVNNAYVVVTAQTVDVGWEVAAGTAQPSSLTLNNSYLFVGNQGTNNGVSTVSVHNESVFALENNSVLIGRTGESFNINIESGSTLSVAGSKLARVDKITNNGTLIISGESTVTADKFTGNGWVYMKGASVGADTKIIGANVRFASGTNVVDGATIEGGRFQVGTGLWGQADPLVDSTVTVTVKNDARIGGTGHASPFGGWIGSQGYDGKDSTLFETKYTLNIYNSIADFDYMHISHDGLMNVVGDASVKDTYAGFDYSYWSGQLNINGIAIFDNVDAAVLNTNVSVDNASSNPGRLIIRNNAFYESDHDNRGSNGGTFKISKTGVVDVLTGATLLVIGKTNISAQGTLNINGATYEHRTASNPDGPDVTNAGVMNITNGNFSATGSVINNGTINVSGVSTIDVTKFSGNAMIASGTLKDSKIAYDAFDGVTGNILADGALTVDGGTFAKVQFRAGEGDTITLEGEIGATATAQFKAVESGAIIVNGTFSSNVGESSTIELEGNDATLTVAQTGKLVITGGFYLNGGTTTITGNLDADDNLAALGKADAQVNVAYSTWGDAYAAAVTVEDTYVWNSMISVKNADTVVTLDNSRLTGWMTFDVYAGKIVANNGSYIEHQAGEGCKSSSIAGTIELNDDSQFVAGNTTVTLNGTITVDATSSVTVGALAGTGIIELDLTSTELKSGECIFNMTGTGALDLSRFNLTVDGVAAGNLEALFGDATYVVINDDYVLMQEGGNDLVIRNYNVKTIYVSASVTGNVGDVITFKGVDYVVGVSAFASLKDISTQVSVAPCTIIYDYTADAANFGGIEFVVKNEGSSLLTYNYGNMDYAVIGSKTHELAFEGTSGTAVFEFANGDFAFSSVTGIEKYDDTPEAIKGNGRVTERDLLVTDLTGDKVYTFTVGTDSTGKLNFAFSDVKGTGMMVMTDAAGNEVMVRLFSGASEFSADGLAAGTYTVALSGYGYFGEAQFDAEIGFTSTPIPAELKDNTMATANDFDVATTSSISNALSAEDTVDWFELTNMTGKSAINFEIISGDSPLFLAFYKADGSLIANNAVSKSSAAIDFTRYVNEGAVFVEVTNMPGKDSTYQISVAQVVNA